MNIEEYTNLQVIQPLNSHDGLALEFMNWCKPEKGKKWICVGCGYGNEVRLIEQEFDPKYVMGVDINSSFIDRIEPTEIVSAMVGYQETLDNVVSDHYDYYYSSQTMEHTYDIEKTITEMKRVLKDGGYAFIGLPWGHNNADSPVHASARKLGLVDVNPLTTLTIFVKRGFKLVDYELADLQSYLELRIKLQK